MSSILKDWVTTLGLRHQGVLLTAVRGCDTELRHGPSKLLTRCYRELILNAHVGDASKSVSFIEKVDAEQLKTRMRAVLNDHDHLPLHYFMHFVHAVEIIGFYHPDAATRGHWGWFYASACKKLHMTPETRSELDARLNAEEQAFKLMQDA